MHSDKNRLWHCFVITLEHSQERRNLISARLGELDMPFEFYPGVDGRKVDLLSHQNYSKWKRRMFFGRDLSNGEFGCILAHKSIYEHIVENNIGTALILEDDAILCDELPDVISALTRNPESWDLVRFLGREKNYRASRKIARLPGTQSDLARPHGTPGGVSWLTKLNTVSVISSPVLPNDQVPSCIDEQDSNTRWDKSVQLSGWRKLIYPLTRGGWKTYSNVLIKYIWFGTLISDRRLSWRLGKS